MKKEIILGASIGTMIEYYDYAIFIIFISILSPYVLGSASVTTSLFAGYSILLISQIMRPFGGLFFGYFGDKIGRKNTLIYSIICISIATILIGLIPGYKEM